MISVFSDVCDYIVRFAILVYLAFVQCAHTRRLSLFGHIARMPDETDAKQILTASPAGNWRKPPGRPRIT